MFIEEQELSDWGILPQMDLIERKQKSIQAYWLDRWYDKMSSITFPTHIYESENEIPDILPFEKCMVRYENKSPKDSEFWGPVSTKKELQNIFYTSLRCKTNPGKKVCVRQWKNLGDEYRCFWNNKLVAVSSESELEPPINQILEYIQKITPLICYHKCVFDIAHLSDSADPADSTDTNKLIFIEYNSWESNSGAHRFDWLDDTEVFYLADCVTFRWTNHEKKVYDGVNKRLTNNETQNMATFITNFDTYTILKPQKPSNWLITEKFIYVANDIWLGRFTLNMKPLNWTRSVFRFNSLQLCEDGSIYAEPNFYYYNLTPKKTTSKIIHNNLESVMNNFPIKFRYGFPVINENNTVVWIRMLDTCEFALN